MDPVLSVKFNRTHLRERLRTNLVSPWEFIEFKRMAMARRFNVVDRNDLEYGMKGCVAAKENRTAYGDDREIYYVAYLIYGEPLVPDIKRIESHNEWVEEVAKHSDHGRLYFEPQDKDENERRITQFVCHCRRTEFISVVRQIDFREIEENQKIFDEVIQKMMDEELDHFDFDTEFIDA